MDKKRKKDALRGIRQKWNRKNNLPVIEFGMEYPYPEEGKELRDAIAEGLELWHFSMEHLDVNWDVRRTYLRDFVEKNPNHFVKTVAMIEMLPTTVWRAILGEYNMDYMSAEAFLRRMTREQEKLIRQNYEELILNGQVPLVLKERKCFSKWTEQSLLEEPLDFERRYVCRAAISHNLLGLDFGYNAYPDGLASDRAVIGEKSFRKFISVKNHVNDFSVNTDYGRYFWFYRTARSNYVFRPGHQVRLKDYICPGFWITLTLHLLFWIVSPLTAIVLTALMAVKYPMSTAVFVPTFFIAAFTPLWCLVAGLKLLVLKITSSERMDELLEWLDDKAKYIAGPILFILACLGTGAVAYCTWIAFDFFQKAFNAVAAVWLILMAYVILGFSIHFRMKKNHLPRFRDFPIYFRIPLYSTAIGIFSLFSAVYHEEIRLILSRIAEIISIGAFFLLEVANLLGLAGLAMGIFLSLGPVLWLVSEKLEEKKREHLFWLMEKYVSVIINVAVFILYVLATVQTIWLTSSIGIPATYGVVLAWLFFYVLFLYCWRMTINIDPKLATLKEVIVDLQKQMEHEFFVSIRQLQRNRWFYSLDRDQQLSIGYEVSNIVSDIFSLRKEKRDEAFGEIVVYLNEKTLPLLRAHLFQLKFTSLKFKIFRQMVRFNMDFESAESIVEKEEARRVMINKIVWKILKIIFFPLVIAWALLKLCRKLILDLVSLVKIILRACPIIVRPEIVRVLRECYDDE